MAAPHPPAGNQKQYTERPLKIFGEQYHAGGTLPVGAVIIVPLGPDPAPGAPRVFTGSQTFIVYDTDWVISNRYSGQPIEVISDEEFSERFGGGNPNE